MIRFVNILKITCKHPSPFIAYSFPIILSFLFYLNAESIFFVFVMGFYPITNTKYTLSAFFVIHLKHILFLCYSVCIRWVMIIVLYVQSFLLRQQYTTDIVEVLHNNHSVWLVIHRIPPACPLVCQIFIMIFVWHQCIAITKAIHKDKINKSLFSSTTR